MAAGPVQVAKRTLVFVLLLLARKHGLQLAVTRESGDDIVLACYRKVIRRVHPDKGGSTVDTQQLVDARDKWEQAKATAAKREEDRKATNEAERDKKGEPKQDTKIVASQRPNRKLFRVHAAAVLLTYNGFADLAQWSRFQSFIGAGSGTCSIGVRHLRHRRMVNTTCT